MKAEQTLNCICDRHRFSKQSIEAPAVLLASSVQSHLLSLCPFLLPLPSQPICPPLQLSSEPVHNPVSYPLPPSQFLPVCPNQQYTVVQNFFLSSILFIPPPLHLLSDLAH